MQISFTFKRNLTVSFVMVSVFDEPKKIFAKIPNIKWQHEELCLLPNMNAFVVDDRFILILFFDKNKWIKGQARYMQVFGFDNEQLIIRFV